MKNEATGKFKSSGAMPSVAPSPSNMRSSRSYPSKGGHKQGSAPMDHPKYAVDGVGGQDQRGSSRSYPSKKSGDNFARPSAAESKDRADGVALTSGGNYGTKGV